MTPGRLRLDVGRRRLLGWGSAYPGPAIATEQLCEQVQAQFGVKTVAYGRRLGARLGVRQRHLCRDFLQSSERPRTGHRNPELAASAMWQAMCRAGLERDALAYLISHTTTPAQPLPAGSAQISRLIGHAGPHMELRQACTGFANALQMAFSMTAQPGSAPVGIVGVETGSVYFDPFCLRDGGRAASAQWVNFLQMGDGAAAVVIGPDDGRDDRPSISAAYFGQCGQAPEPGLQLHHGGSDRSLCSAGVLSFEHDYSAVAQHGLALLEYGRQALAQAGHALETAQWVVPHQASGALASWLAPRWHLQPSRICTHGAQVGNLGSASIWAALDHLLCQAPVDCSGKALFLGAEATQYSYGGFALTWSGDQTRV